MYQIFKTTVLLCALIVLSLHTALAQWVTQTIQLQAGWNAIYLEVEPYPRECQLLIQDKPIRSIWHYNQSFSPVQFIQDPSELTPETPQWFSFFQPSLPESVSNDLFILEAGKSYLIEATEASTWEIIGKTKFVQQQWTPNSYNLVGFQVDPQSPPTFSSWFQPSAAHNPLEVWTLDTNQNWIQIQDPATSPIDASKAYWVMCNGVSNYQGPYTVQLSDGYHIEFGRLLAENQFVITRNGNAARTVSLSLSPSMPAPTINPNADTDSLYPNAGVVPLKYQGQETQGDTVRLGYVNFPASYAFAANDPSPKLVELAIDRTQMTPYTGEAEARYQSILEIRDGQGYLKRIGVVSEGLQSNSINLAGFRTQQINDPSPYTGLWIGYVTLDQIQEPNLDILTETPATFGFRLIIHLDENGNTRLLNEVTQLWRDGTYKPDPQPGFPNAQSVDQPGRFILITPTAPASLLNELRIGENVFASSLRDGRPFARRVSSAMFSLLDEDNNPIDPIMVQDGTFGQNGGQLSTVLVLENTDPQNPFHHQYHPQHAYPQDGDVVTPNNDWTITREIVLEFSDTHFSGTPPAGWGDSVLGGTYLEILNGLKKQPFQVAGSFELSRVSTVPVLNDGLNLADN